MASTEYAAVQTSSSGLRPQPRRSDQSASQPPAGKPISPAPALNAAVRPAAIRLLSAASRTICTDQKLKNHRFHRIAM
jgi:hypothetical protein